MAAPVTTKRRRRRADAVDNEEKVRAAAMAVLLRRDEAITMDEVAAEAGVAKGTVYNTFGSRQAMLEEVTVAHVDANTRLFEAALESDGSAWDGLVGALEACSLGVGANARNLGPDAPAGPVKDAIRRCEAVISALLERAKEEGSVRPEITAAHTRTLFRGLYLALPPYSPDTARLIREHVQIILRGIRA